MPKPRPTILTGPRILIAGPVKRHVIVKTVVNHFIKFEHSRKGPGVKFRYPVEVLAGGESLFIARPGHKKNFDFKVDVLPMHGLGGGSHEELAAAVVSMSRGPRAAFRQFWGALTEMYHCRENDVDKLLGRRGAARGSAKRDANVEASLKILKWCFIMEDIVYWDNEGRAFLYNWLQYRANERDRRRLKKVQEAIKWEPAKLRKYLPELGLKWVASEG